MRAQMFPKLPKWPFFVASVLLVGAGFYIGTRSKGPIDSRQLTLAVCCVTCGVVVWVVPFLLEYRLLSRVVEAENFKRVTARLEGLEKIAKQISVATDQWQGVHEQAEATAAGARQISERMATEARAFTEFIQRTNDSEKTNLRLEVEKLRRAEADWLQVLVRMMDHVYALHQGAVRSGQENVMEQVGHFQSACRDAVRRVGLTPIVAGAAEPYDGQRHQLVEGEGPARGGARIRETVAAGYTFQGKLLRPALVRLQTNGEG
jgi:molecular chaperone GrpE (heat shock protein)